MDHVDIFEHSESYDVLYRDCVHQTAFSVDSDV